MQLKTLFSAALPLAVASAQMMNLTSLIASNSNLSSLATLLQSVPNVTTTLAAAKNVTLFAPNNQALSALQSTLSSGGNTSDLIQSLLSYHVLPGMMYADNFTSTPIFAHSLLNNTSYSNVTGGQVVEGRLNGNNVTLTSGLKMNSNVTQANLNFTGGVVHVIDSVLTIPENVSTTAGAANLTALAGALVATGLLDTVDAMKDVTIFAPSNTAFQDIGSATGNLSTDQLKSILEYHVINGTVAYSSLLGNGSVKTLGGGNVTITVADHAVFINSARVINADVLVSGGVMHIIDSVLNPNNSMASAMPSNTAAPTQYSGASSASDVPFTSGVPTPTVTITQLLATTIEVASGYSTTNRAPVATTGSATGKSSSSSGGAAMPTGAVGAAALFGGAAFMANW